MMRRTRCFLAAAMLLMAVTAISFAPLYAHMRKDFLKGNGLPSASLIQNYHRDFVASREFMKYSG